ncbi:pLS20_p028 family conjugation system transmembrane protein [Siminovitchia sediminis]|uniref:PLS20_p028 family conjugation system transmembrane protein n=1 Tax=Siminovitchia sediminis TaxID=1274353 RepID=A0ABW4KDT8_9BACI
MKRKLKKFSILFVFTSLLSIFSLLVTKYAFAVTDEELLDEYEKMDSVMHISSGWLYDDILRSVGWAIIKGLAWLNNYFEDIVTKVVTMNNFYSSPNMEGLMNVVKPLVFGLFVIAVFVLGFQFMMNKIEKRGEVILNILMAVAVVVIIPVLMSSLGKVVNVGMDHMDKHNPGGLAGGVIKSNVVDLKYYADKDFKTAGKGTKYVGNSSTPPRPINRNNVKVGTTEYKYANKLNGKITDISVNEKLDLSLSEKKGGFKKWGKSLSDKSEELLKNKAVPTGNGTKKVVQELGDSQIMFTELGKETYYRYHVNWGTTIFSLLITAFALVITVIKVGRAIFDLAFHQIFGMFVAVTDLTGGQRTKKILAEIANTFGVIFIMVFILKLFTLYANWVSGLKPAIGGIGVVLMLIAGAWAVIDAPDIVQRLMGIDAGLRSGYGALMGAYAAAGLAGKLGKGAKNLIGGVARKGAGLASFGAGAMKGVAGRQRSKTPVPKVPSSGGSNPLGLDNSGISKEQLKGGQSRDIDAQPIPSNNETTQLSMGDISNEQISDSDPGGNISKENFDKIPDGNLGDPSKINASSGGAIQEQAPIPSLSPSDIAHVSQEKAGQSPIGQVGGGANKSIQGIRQGNMNIPSGYTQTSSGLIVPAKSVQGKGVQTPIASPINAGSGGIAHVSQEKAGQSPIGQVGDGLDKNIQRIGHGDMNIPSGYTQAPSGLIVPAKSVQGKGVQTPIASPINAGSGGIAHVSQEKAGQSPIGQVGDGLDKNIQRIGHGDMNIPSGYTQAPSGLIVPAKSVQGKGVQTPIASPINAGSGGIAHVSQEKAGQSPVRQVGGGANKSIQGIRQGNMNIPSGYTQAPSGLIVPAKPVQGKGVQTPIASQNAGSGAKRISQGNMNIPSGYTQTSSGLIVPAKPVQGKGVQTPIASPINAGSGAIAHVSQQNTGQSPVRQSGIQKPIASQIDTGSGGTANTPIASPVKVISQQIQGLTSQVQASNQQIQQMQGMLQGGSNQGGWVTGSPSFQRLRNEVTRAGNSGYAFGQTIRKATGFTTRAIGKSAVNTVRAVAHPRQTVRLAGVKLHQAQLNVAQKGANKVRLGKQKIISGTKNIVREIRTPLGSDTPISINSTNIRGNNNDIRG